MDRHWTSFQEELPYWFCSDEQQNRIDREPEQSIQENPRKRAIFMIFVDGS
jgi:hypothetical protein